MKTSSLPTNPFPLTPLSPLLQKQHKARVGACQKSSRGSSFYRAGLENVFFKTAAAWFGINKLVVRALTCVKLYELTLRNYLKRPEWLYGKGVDLDPARRFTFRPPPPGDDTQLCERLIRAYLASARSDVNLSGIWRKIFATRYDKLLIALDSGDSKRLSSLLARMFQEDFLWGITSCAFGLRAGCFTRIKLVEELVALAEALGVVRTETPEQGTPGHALAEGLQPLVEQVEACCGVSLDFPNVGGAYGVKVGGRLLTPETPESIYVARRIQEVIANQFEAGYQPRILEIGAGFGGMAYWLMQMQAVGSYTIVDLRLVNVCQGYFMAKVFGESAVRFYGEPESGTKIAILPAHAKDEILQCDLVLNQNSMPEIPENAVRDYLAWIKYLEPKVFYSYNQEAMSPNGDGDLQTLVPLLVAQAGDFKRLSRNYSWIHRGYVEEVYILNPNLQKSESERRPQSEILESLSARSSAVPA